VRARLPYLLLIPILMAAAGLHAHVAANATTSYQSADERAYGKLALNIAEQRHYGDRSTKLVDPLRWPPGAPFLFAAAHLMAPSATSDETNDLPAAYWAQALVSMGTVLCAWGLALAVAGPWAALVAAALVGTYPPLVFFTGEQLSEPLGAFLLTAAFLALAGALKRRVTLLYAVTGGIFGLAVLTRADLLPVPFVVAALTTVWVSRHLRDPRRGLLAGGLLAGAAALAIAPWVYYVSARSGMLVPVTRGSASALFVGTYLPGNGTTVGMKRALAAEVKRRNPELRGRGAMDIESKRFLALIAERHPDLPRDAAIEKEARRNIVRYGKSDPIGFGLMMANKVQRMWSRYARGGARHTSAVIRGWHIVLVLGGFAGVLLGAWRRRSGVLAAIFVVALCSTALHTLMVSQARYNLPLMPALITGGVTGSFLLVRRRGRPPEEPAPKPDQPAPDERPAATSV
jgi:4-amino-4-deoxy-L-arabinose transferase-like glycosyltransferase